MSTIHGVFLGLAMLINNLGLMIYMSGGRLMGSFVMACAIAMAYIIGADRGDKECQ